ncbi:hypothetical protein Nepgr_012102 [Nepenthes gracilis]|uniref:Uncharacterized protein n=1 Tax=Nepenthes gracilis TaxID=150966 RepID=A0AAD3XMZ8_NEPGR|nr:hypothetical protein Nepgr_012102 [Nepenthes gracilis]
MPFILTQIPSLSLRPSLTLSAIPIPALGNPLLDLFLPCPFVIPQSPLRCPFLYFPICPLFSAYPPIFFLLPFFELSLLFSDPSLPSLPRELDCENSITPSLFAPVIIVSLLELISPSLTTLSTRIFGFYVVSELIDGLTGVCISIQLISVTVKKACLASVSASAIILTKIL